MVVLFHLLTLSLPQQELASLRQKLSATVSGTLEVDLATQLDSRLEGAIDELREKSELEIAQYKMEIEESYRDKVWDSHVVFLTATVSSGERVGRRGLVQETVVYCLGPDSDHLQIVALENQSTRDSATITKLSAEIHKLNSTFADNNSELAKIKKAVSLSYP